MKDEKIEQLAHYAHSAWSGWMFYMFSKCIRNEDNTMTIPKEFVDRWSIQMQTDYYDLPENQKPSDRAEAQKMIDIFNASTNNN